MSDLVLNVRLDVFAHDKQGTAAWHKRDAALEDDYLDSLLDEVESTLWADDQLVSRDMTAGVDYENHLVIHHDDLTTAKDEQRIIELLNNRRFTLDDMYHERMADWFDPIDFEGGQAAYDEFADALRDIVLECVIHVQRVS